MTVTVTDIVAPIAASLACLLAIPAGVAHVRAKNLPTTVLTLGMMVLNLQNAVNALIWSSEDSSTWWQGQGLCDVEVKLYLGIGVAVDGAIVCIFRHISHVLDPRHMTVSPSTQERRRRLVVEWALCGVLPCLVMGAHYVVQRDRYAVRISAGCTPTYDRSWPTALLVLSWPLALCLVAVCYCIVVVLRLWQLRREMDLVMGNRPGLSPSRFRRLLILASGLLLLYLPLTLAASIKFFTRALHPYSWAYVHPADWAQRIILQPGRTVSFDGWSQIVTGYLSFLLFGLGHDATRMYRGWVRSVKALAPSSLLSRVPWRRRRPRPHPGHAQPHVIGRGPRRVDMDTDTVVDLALDLESEHRPVHGGGHLTYNHCAGAAREVRLERGTDA